MSESETNRKLNGIFPAIFTPFDDSGRVDLQTLSKIAEFQLERGASGFFVCGSTGEGLLLSFDERVEIIEHMAANFGDRSTIIAHVGHPSTDFAVELAREAADSGAHWISSVGPVYHGTSFEGAVYHYQKIASATDLPFMIYALLGEVDPQRDRVFFDIPNVCGIKYTGSQFHRVRLLVDSLDREITTLSGMDEQFVAGQAFGFDGGIGSTYNFAPQMYSQMYTYCQTNDFKSAAEIQRAINRVTELMVRSPNWNYAKAVMRFIGLNLGSCRAPFQPLTEDEYKAFATELEKLDVLERVSS